MVLPSARRARATLPPWRIAPARAGPRPGCWRAQRSGAGCVGSALAAAAAPGGAAASGRDGLAPPQAAAARVAAPSRPNLATRIFGILLPADGPATVMAAVDSFDVRRT